MRMLCLTITVFLMGLVVHYLCKDSLVQEVWSPVYFVWDKVKDLLLFSNLLCFVTDKKARFSVWGCIFFCIVRLVWQGLAIETDYLFASQYRIIDALLVIVVIVIVSNWIYPIFRNGKKRSLTVVSRGGAGA